MKRIAKIVLAVGALGLAWGVYSLMRADRALTEKPERVATTWAPPVVSSDVSIPIRLEHAALTQLANDLIPESYDIPSQRLFQVESGTTNPLSGSRIAPESISISGRGLVRRTSPVTVTAEQDGLTVATNIHAAFTAEKGPLSQTAMSDARVTVRISLDVNEKWEPVVTVTPSYEWTRRPVARLFNLFDLPLGTVAEAELDRQIATMRSELPALVRQWLPLQSIMASAWDQAHTTVRLPSEPEMWLTFDPVSAYLRPPSAENGDLLLNVGFVANVGLSTDQPATPKAEPLPAPSQAASDVPGFRLGVPTQLGYGALEDALTAAVGDEAIEFGTPVGEATIRILDVEVYPSAPNLVVGAKVDLDLPDRWLDTKGWVYLHAAPSFDAGTKELRLRNMTFARSVDNTLVRLATAAFSSQIERALESRARVDLRGPLEGAMARANTLLGADLQQRLRDRASRATGPLADVISMIDVTAKVDGLSSVSFALEEQRLILVPVVTGSLSVQLQPALNAPPARVAAEDGNAGR